MIWTEWDNLKTVIVGNVGSRFNLGNDRVNSYVNQILDETKEDLDKLSNFLKSGGINVLRPTFYEQESFTMSPIVPRDQYLVYGDIIYSTFTSMKDRYYDSYFYYDIFKNLFDLGLNWIQQPMPDIPKLDNRKAWWDNARTIYGETYKDKLLLHTATITKVGDSLIYHPKGPGTQSGIEWFKRNLPVDIKFIASEDTISNGYGHIDQGWFLADDETVVCLTKDWVPSCLLNKEIIEIHEHIEFPDLSKYGKDLIAAGGKYTEKWLEHWLSEWRGYAQDVCFDTNVLMLSPRKILLSNPQPKLEKYLESKGIECYSTRLRHGLFWESGVHCCTLDVEREGNKRPIV